MKLSRNLFEPQLPLGDRRINVDRETRRIAVRIASWNDAHSGFKGAVRMPRNVNVEAAHVGRATLEDGSDIAVATLPMHTMHAGAKLDAAHAAAWYENTGTGAARVRYSVDDEGIRADGVLYEDLSQENLDRLIASAPSGDWRAASLVRRPEDFEHAAADFAGACIVNIPGYSGTFSDSPATPLRLVASADSMMLIEEGAIAMDEETETPEACEGDVACEGCTCGKADAPEETLEGLQASAAEIQVKIDALTAAASVSEEATDLSLIEERITSLEEIVARAILSM